MQPFLLVATEHRTENCVFRAWVCSFKDDVPKVNAESFFGALGSTEPRHTRRTSRKTDDCLPKRFRVECRLKWGLFDDSYFFNTLLWFHAHSLSDQRLGWISRLLWMEYLEQNQKVRELVREHVHDEPLFRINHLQLDSLYHLWLLFLITGSRSKQSNQVDWPPTWEQCRYWNNSYKGDFGFAHIALRLEPGH